MPTFDGSEGRQIPTAEAAGYTSQFRTDYRNNKKAYFVGVDNINALIGQNGTMGFRIYLGIKNIDGVNQIMPILVSADEDGEDIIGICIDDMCPCPNMCSTNSPLMK